MLPAKMPDARIMTFNYESAWMKDAPRKRLPLVAERLLDDLGRVRQEVGYRYNARGRFFDLFID